MLTPLKIAFATDDVRQVNQHFTSARTFAIYAVDPDQVELLAAAEPNLLECKGEEEQLVATVDLLAGCAAVYALSFSAPAAQQLIARGLRPIKVDRGAAIAGLISDVQDDLTRCASAWRRAGQTG